MANWTDIADTKDLPAGARLCTRIDGKELVVLNVDGTLYAIANQCPHAGRPLENGEVQGQTITCPFHGYTYNLRNGKNLDYPDLEPPVPMYPVRIQNNTVQLLVEHAQT